MLIAARPAPAMAAELSLTAAPPSNFADLEGPRDVMVDVYFSGHHLGVARAAASPGSLRFEDPAGVADLLAPYANAPEIRRALSAALPSNAGQACSRMLSSGCGTLDPRSVGVIFDEDRFRVDLFLSNDLLARPLTTEVFLSPSSEDFAAVATLGAALSGTSRDDPRFNLQGRGIVSLGSSRLKSNISYSSELGAVADDFLVEVDRPNQRYLAGLFWTPGTSLVGRRRIIGVGAASQYDTRSDRERLEGTPLPLFVQQRSLVELLIDGRLVSSQLVEPGNQLLETSGLPQGSYPLVARIREQGGRVTEERRFFVKDENFGPPGKFRFKAFAGMLAPTRSGRLVSASDTFFYQLGAARRLSDTIGIETSLLGTQDKLISETSLALLTARHRVRVSALASSAGEFGAVLQLGSNGRGRLQYSFDLRRVWDRKGQGLVPGSFDGIGFDGESPNHVPDLGGDYTQLNAMLGYTLGRANLRLFASYSKNDRSGSEFSIGPNIDWLVARGPRFQLRAEADAQKMRGTTAGYVGLRFQFTGSGLASVGTMGLRAQDARGSDPRARHVGSLSSEWSGTSEGWGRYSLGAGFDRSIGGTAARARGALDSARGNVRADLLHNFGGPTQYSLGLQTGAALGPKVTLGGHQISESALVVEVEGAKGAGRFEVLVDEASVATVSAGKAATVFLQPYRRYAVRLRALSASPMHFDASTRQVTLFPGNVDRQRWEATSVFTVFGQLVDGKGRPVRNGLLQGRHGNGASDLDGYFQIDVAANDRVTVSSGAAKICQLDLDRQQPRHGFSAAGKVVCQ